jgi:hypothetical protein
MILKAEKEVDLCEMYKRLLNYYFFTFDHITLRAKVINMQLISLYRCSPRAITFSELKAEFL